MRNVLFFICLIAVALTLNSCRISYLSYRKLKVDKSNPTSYMFHAPIDSVVHVMNDWEKNNKRDWFTFEYTVQSMDRKSVLEVYEGYEGDEEYFYQIRKIAPSPVYVNKLGGGLKDYICFLIACDSIGPDRAIVRIFSNTSRVTRAYFHPLSVLFHGFYLSKDVPPVGIEEYRVLRYIGKKIGEKDMPPIHYPEGWTEEELERLFRRIY